jgi:NAD(P)H-hydrate epimerase
MNSALALLTVEQMRQADALAIASGVSGERLMENAGAAVARAILGRFLRCPTTVMCGPGNNGGDGFVVARLLAEARWPVRVALLGAREALRGDAALVAAKWPAPVEPLTPACLDGAQLAVDAIFGAGLTRPVEGQARATVEALNRRRLNCVAIDVPSGVEGDSGAVLGAAPQARLTVTFFRRKPGHLLLPGFLHCGETELAQIGIPDSVLDEIAPETAENGPALWLDRFAWPYYGGHKYDRGHAVVLGGAPMTGAGRLAAEAAARIGAGLVTIACPETAFDIYASQRAHLLVQPMRGRDSFAQVIADPRRNAVLLGPGSAPSGDLRAAVLDSLAAGKACVLDAGAITAFSDGPDSLFSALTDRCVLTPHGGEFARLFPDLGNGDKLTRARAAAVRSGAVVLFKGTDTVVAAPDRRTAINAGAPSELATAGSGDTLAGIILGLLAQGMSGFDAACAAVWIHAEAARRFGPGLVADDLSGELAAILRYLRYDLADLALHESSRNRRDQFLRPHFS